jgi:hypothetical protein
MSTSEARAGDKIAGVRFTDDSMSVDLEDGRSISVPLASYPRLLHATADQRNRWEASGAGYGLHWPDLDEDLSVEGLIRGAPSAGIKTPGAGGTA